MMFLVCFTGLVHGQQMTNSSFFMFNKFQFNPAVAGSEDDITIFSSIRRQWVRIQEAPVMQTLGSHAYAGSHVGIGANFFNDAAGPSRRTGLSFSADRHFQLSSGNDTWLSLGLSANMFQYAFDESKLRFDLPDDPVLGTTATSRMVPDAAFGAFFYGENYDVGFSVQNLIQARINLFDIENQINNQMMRHYYLTGTYDFLINDQFSIMSSALVKYVAGAPVQADVTALFHFLNLFYVGPGFRSMDAVYMMTGINYERISFGYAFDYTYNTIKSYTSGTHEIYVALSINNALNKDGHLSGMNGRRKPYYKQGRKRR